jgi:long-chain fatty acid transport protein
MQHVAINTARSRGALIALAMAALTLQPAPVAAQSSLQVPIQFDFLSPGARSLGLGSAFVGLADDATAAWVNPAGLLELAKPEISIEGRYRRLAQPFLVGGRLSGVPTGWDQDTVAGPVYRDIVDASTRPAFFSFVYPRKTFRFAVYRHEPIRVNQRFSSTGVFQFHGFDNRDTAFAGQRTIEITSYGASVAQQWRRVWLGAGLAVNHFSLKFDFNRFLYKTLYSVPDPSLQIFEFTQTGDSTAAGIVVGVMVPVTKTTKVGASYRRMSSFRFSSFSGGLAGSQQHSDAEFNAPDVLAAGLSKKFKNDTLLISTEYKHVFHSQLRADYVDVLVNQGESRTKADRFSIADANEVHAGAEYILPFGISPAVRAGVWFDPDHSVHFAPTAANDLLDERIAASLSSGRDLWHYTAGASVAVHPRVELSVGADHSARSLMVSSSVIFRF